MKLAAQPKKTTLHVFLHKGEILAATFDAKVANRIAQTVTNWTHEQHEAKSATTIGMYGKLFGLSGAQHRGGMAANKAMTKEEKHARAVTAANARWHKST